MNSEPAIVGDWLSRTVETHGSKPALRGISGPSLTYAELVAQTGAIADHLANAGVGRGDVVLIALPDGPEMLVAILAAACVGTALPVSAHEHPDRLKRLFEEINVRAVVCDERNHEILSEAAASDGIALGRLHLRQDASAAMFELDMPVRASRSTSRPTLDDSAILIATGGTTSAAKIVSSSHASLFASIAHCADWLKLTVADRSLCIMPFAHLHSIVRSTFPALLVGAEVVATPGFDRQRVLDWIAEFRPSLITAAPSLYRTIVQTANERGSAATGSLRVMVTGSDRIDRETIADVQRVFGAPLVQFYGLSEVAPLVATTPLEGGLPPAAVGRLNPRWSLSIVDDGVALPAGGQGEIAIKGGFINPLVGKSAPAQRMTEDGYLLTGDLGRVDVDGNLYVLGRVDDRIHRGGEKIDPSAVEEVLRTHPDVREAAVFGIPDPVLGQRVGAALVAADGRASAADIQAFVARHLFSYMVPETIVAVSALPVNAAGKVVRKQLAEILNVSAAPGPPVVVPPVEDGYETRLSEMFRRRLSVADLSRDARFFDLGGDSFGAVELLVEIEDAFGINIPPATFIGNSSVAAVAALLRAKSNDQPKLQLVALNANGRLPPLFVTYPPEGYVAFASTMADALGSEQPLHVFNAPRGRDGPAEPETMEEKAAKMIGLIKAAQPQGPYYVAGYSFGAHAAFEIAQQLTAIGDTMAFVGVIDDQADLQQRRSAIEQVPPAPFTTFNCNHWALRRYVPKPYAGRLTLFRASGGLQDYLSDALGGWDDLALGGVDVYDVAGDHESIVTTDGFNWGPILSSALAKSRHAASLPRGKKQSKARKPVPKPAPRHLIAARVACKRGDAKTEIAEYRRAAAAGAMPLWAMRNLAEALIESGSTDAGLGLMDEALALDPWPLAALAKLAELKVRLNRSDGLERLYEQARAIVPEDSDAMFAFGHLCRMVNKLPEAEAALRRSLELDEQRAYGHYSRGHKYSYLADILQRRGRHEEAIAAGKDAVNCHPQDAGKVAQLGSLYATAGRKSDAADWYRRALVLNPAMPGLQERLKELTRPG